MQRIDFFAKWSHYIDHMAPIYHALGDTAGDFFMPGHLAEYARNKHKINPFILTGGNAYPVAMTSNDPILVASHADLQTVIMTNHARPAIMMEHGVGLVFPGNASYAGNVGYRKRAAFTLAPNKIVYRLNEKAIPGIKQMVIGTPKLDRYADWFERPFRIEHPIPQGKIVRIAFGFHWDGGNVAPETGSAFSYFNSAVTILNKTPGLKVIGHCHPRAIDKIVPFYKKNNIHYEPDFDVVMREADVYINDASSTLYEFLVTGKPVIIMNSPRYRRNINFGIRFWDFTDIGPQVNNVDELLAVLGNVIRNPSWHMEERRRAVEILFPLLGRSAEYAASAIQEFFKN